MYIYGNCLPIYTFMHILYSTAQCAGYIRMKSVRGTVAYCLCPFHILLMISLYNAVIYVIASFLHKLSPLFKDVVLHAFLTMLQK